MSLLEIQRQQFLNALESVRPSSRYKIVVVDSRSLKVLGAVIKLSEILEYDVLRIDSIEKRRKPEPDVEAMYFLTPSDLSIKYLLEDFTITGQHNIKGGLMYKAAHLFFTSELNDRLFDKVSNSSIKMHIAALKELCVEYDPNFEFFRSFSPKVSANCASEVELISKKIVNVCLALGEYPKINYFQQPADSQHHLSRQIAFFSQSELDKAFPPDKRNENDSNSMLLIVDRCIDLVAPLLHEFTYEAMAMDLASSQITFDKYIPSYKYIAELGNGESEERISELTENDRIWSKYRYEHISDAQTMMMKEVDDLAKDNKAILNLQSGAKQNINKLRDVVGAMPKFKALMAEYSAHISLMQNIMKKFNSLNLSYIGLIEQNLVTSLNPEKTRYTMGSFDVSEILTDSSVDEAIKHRVLLIYLLSTPNLSQNERSQLVTRSALNRIAFDALLGLDSIVPFESSNLLSKKIEKDCKLAIQKQKSSSSGKPGSKLTSLGWSALSSVASQQFKSKNSPTPVMSLRTTGKSYGTPTASAHSSRAQTPSNIPEEEEKEPYDVSRYVPVIKSVIESAILGCLDTKNFPSVVPTPDQLVNNDQNENSSNTTSIFKKTRASSNYSQNQNSSATSNAPSNNPPAVFKSLRSTKPSWQKAKSPDANTHLSQPTSQHNLNTSVSDSYRTPSNSPLHSKPSSLYGNNVSAPSSPVPSYSHSNNLIIYVAGGITYSEIRTIRLLSAKYNYPITIGSSHIINPNTYVAELASVKNDSHLKSLAASSTSTNSGGVYLETANVFEPSCISIGFATPSDIDPLVSFNNSRVSANGSATPGLSGNAANSGKSVEEMFMEKFKISEQKWKNIQSGSQTPSMHRSESLGLNNISSMHRVKVNSEAPPASRTSSKKEQYGSSPAVNPPVQQKKGFFKKLI
ncbi:Protein transport protein sec1 [Smittium culicis]|uniref:Protein transport protein sec1 n=1 Tax=Smittium culicis TaxID=133412 RepID=A0A1R1Y3T4_9FUNG|nr:Protein transport protein sec1 [Smittium culicis]